jgi:hypothetical protein
MKAAERTILIAIALFVLGLLLAMNWTPRTAIDKGTGSPVGIPANLASTNTSIELVSSVDWSKIKQEAMSPTF